MMKIREDMFNSCKLTFSNQDVANPGEEIDVSVNFLNKEIVIDYLKVGKQGEFYEGNKIVARGKIMSIDEVRN